MADPWTGAPDAGPRWRTVLVAAEFGLVVVLLLGWLFMDGVQESMNLWVLFFYSFPSEFLVGLVPHEPALIYFGAYHPAWVVAAVAAVGTAMAEAMNYSVFSYFYDRPAIRRSYDHPAVRKTMGWFDRAPFAVILFAGFTPAPFFPVRFLVVMTGYSPWRYIAGVLLSRTPRFFILAAVGGVVDIPVGMLGGLFLVMLLSVNLPALVQLTRRGVR
ncbi:MAG TPA: VTT domain-containing protein [Longimicrobiales bacterium]|nr:VTT domain-containing protein [Longimicrobiales bacterium]